jgi:single-strand DNA-binding protein
MASLNKVMIIGNVGSEPEMRFTPAGKPVTTFSVATNHNYTSPEGERKEETEWLRWLPGTGWPNSATSF